MGMSFSTVEEKKQVRKKAGPLVRHARLQE